MPSKPPVTGHERHPAHQGHPLVGDNVITFRIVAGVLYPFTLSPEIAALSISGNSAVMAINALLLTHIKLDGIQERSINEGAGGRHADSVGFADVSKPMDAMDRDSTAAATAATP